jgi:predicted transcriptional regulator
MPGPSKNVLLRLDPDLAERLQALAAVEGQPVTAVIREAIALHVDRRRRDPVFRELLAKNLEQHQRLLQLLDDDT